MWTNLQFPTNLFTITKETISGKRVLFLQDIPSNDPKFMRKLSKEA